MWDKKQIFLKKRKNREFDEDKINLELKNIE